MNAIEILLLCEAVVAIILIMIVIAVAAAIKKSRKGSGRLYDPYGLYAPVTAEQLAESDRAAALTCAEAKQMQQNTQNTNNTHNA